MSWQPKDHQMDELLELGSTLSLKIGCPVRWPAFDKNMFECKCGILFPIFIVKGGDWDAIISKHNNENNSL